MSQVHAAACGLAFRPMGGMLARVSAGRVVERVTLEGEGMLIVVMRVIGKMAAMLVRGWGVGAGLLWGACGTGDWLSWAQAQSSPQTHHLSRPPLQGVGLFCEVVGCAGCAIGMQSGQLVWVRLGVGG